MADRTLNLHVTGLPAFKAMIERLREIHQPMDEEAEWWIEDDGHDERFPGCPAITDPHVDCRGHHATIQVCRECGYEHDGDRAFFRSWPCPTLEAVAALAETEEP